MIAFLVASYIAALFFLYKYYLAPVWGGVGFGENISSITPILSSVLILIISYLYVSRSKNNTSGYIIFIFLNIYFIPSLIFSLYSNTIATYSIVLVDVFIIICLFSYFPVFTRNIIIRTDILAVLILAIVTMMLLVELRYTGWSSFNLDPFRVYEFRRESAGALPAIFGYILSPVTKVMIPALAVLALVRRSVALGCATAFLTIFIFGVSHHKSIIAGPVVAAGLYFLLSMRRPYLLLSLGFFSIAAIALSEWLFIYLSGGNAGDLVFNTLVTRRALFIPPLLDSFYLDFFSDNPKYFWASSRFSLGLVENPYHTAAPFLIGQEYLGSSGTSANSGVVGSGYANAGLGGVVLYAALLGLTIAFLDKCGQASSHAYVTSIAAFPLLTVLMSTDFTTALLTHGFLLLLLYAMIVPSQFATVDLSDDQ